MALVSLSWPVTCIYSSHLSLFLSLPSSCWASQCTILLVLSPFPHGFLSASPIPSLERAAKEPGAIVWDVPVLFLHASPVPWRPPRGYESRVMARIMSAMLSAPSRGLAHCWGSADIWVNFWMNRCCKFAMHLVLSAQFTDGENLISRGGKEMIPSSIPDSGQRPFLLSCHIVLEFGPSSLELGHKDFRSLNPIVG